MWTSVVWMGWFAGRPPKSRPTSAADHVLSRVRHPSFTPELAEKLVRGLPRRRLQRLWSESSRMLATTTSDEIRFSVVVFRDHVLRELERHDPSAVEACARAALRGRRADRS